MSFIKNKYGIKSRYPASSDLLTCRLVNLQTILCKYYSENTYIREV